LIRKSVSDYPLVILALLLSAYGIAIVYSAGQTDFPVAYIVGAWKRQLGWFVLSLVAAYALFRASVRLVDG
jgi:rod shape determining protein RodA